MTLDPQSTVAASICWLARQSAPNGKGGLPQIPELRRAVNSRHQSVCGWCDYELAGLMSLIEEGLRGPDIARFERLAQAEQRRLVIRAQALEGVA